MSTESRAMIAQKACTRCSKSKKRCDRAIPACGLCVRFRRICEYEVSKASNPLCSQVQASDLTLAPEPNTPSYLKNTIIHKLQPFTPEMVISAYHRAIEPWFPIAFKLQNRLRPTWDENSLDVALLCLSIILLTTSPNPAPSDNNASDFKRLYPQIKSSLALAEGLGLNSFPIVQARILNNLFEVSHGFYPAAYISIGATLRAADALEIYPMENTSQPHYSDGAMNYEETVLTWCGILVLDRYIATESGRHPSLTRPRTEWLHNFLKPALCPTHEPSHDRNSPVARFARLAESSAILDKIHITINSPTTEQIYNVEELMLAVKTAFTLQSLLIEEITTKDYLYSGGLALCQIAVLLAFENSTKVHSLLNSPEDWKSSAIESLSSILSTITSTIEPFTVESRSVDFNHFSPFIIFLVYKAAIITTKRVSMELDVHEGMVRLRTLRKFLKIVAKRWLDCDRYLKLLDEDTTPRMIKIIEQT